MKHDLQKCLQRHPQICFKRRWQISDETIYRLGKCEAIVNALSMMLKKRNPQLFAPDAPVVEV